LYHRVLAITRGTLGTRIRPSGTIRVEASKTTEKEPKPTSSASPAPCTARIRVRVIVEIQFTTIRADAPTINWLGLGALRGDGAYSGGGGGRCGDGSGVCLGDGKGISDDVGCRGCGRGLSGGGGGFGSGSGECVSLRGCMRNILGFGRYDLTTSRRYYGSGERKPRGNVVQIAFRKWSGSRIDI